MAINLGGKGLAAAVSGIDEILNKSNYNFSNAEHRTLFMNQFCSYAEITKDIKEFNQLETRMEEIEILGKYLEDKRKDLIENCDDCRGIDIAWKASKKAKPFVDAMDARIEQVKLEIDEDKRNYSFCTDMDTAFHTENSNFKLFMQVLEGYENDRATQSELDSIASVVRLSKLYPQKFLNNEQCGMLPKDQKVDLAQDFNITMRDDVLTWKDKLFNVTS